MILRILYMANCGRRDADHSGLPLLASPPTAYMVNQNSIFKQAINACNCMLYEKEAHIF